jgi:hypothetical protein
VWRDGQERRVYVYRFLTTGTIEEKVLPFLKLGLLCRGLRMLLLLAACDSPNHG